MITDINSEDRLVQQTFAEHLDEKLGWESVYAWNQETLGPNSTLSRGSEREVIFPYKSHPDVLPEEWVASRFP